MDVDTLAVRLLHLATLQIVVVAIFHLPSYIMHIGGVSTANNASCHSTCSGRLIAYLQPALVGAYLYSVLNPYKGLTVQCLVVGSR